MLFLHRRRTTHALCAFVKVFASMPGDPSEQPAFLRAVDDVDQASFRPVRSYQSHVRTDGGVKFSLANPTFTAIDAKVRRLPTASQQIFSPQPKPIWPRSPPIMTVPACIPTGFGAGSSTTIIAVERPVKAWVTYDPQFSTARR